MDWCCGRNNTDKNERLLGSIHPSDFAEPEPEPQAEEVEPPEPNHEPASLRRAPSTYEDYVRHGISVPGIRHVVTQFGVGERPSPSTRSNDFK